LAVGLSVLALAVGLWFGVTTAGASDSYGYVSQADLWLKGQLVLDQPLYDEMTWRWANWALAPLGYRPGERGGTMVPIYSPGLPLQMAAFKAVGGERAVYVVVPLLGALAVWWTFVLGRAVADPAVAALAAFALLVSPVFLGQLVWPWSDVPVTAWWLAATVAALGGPRKSAVLSGLAASAAILTRPNLVPLAAVVALLVAVRSADGRERRVRLFAYGLAAAPGALAVALINTHLYGSPLASGYGTLQEIYAPRYFWTNVVRYPIWLLEMQTPFVLLAFAAPFLLRRSSQRLLTAYGWFAATFFLVLWGLYLWYTPYDHPGYLRFLLPAFPALLVAAAAAFGALLPPAGRVRAAGFAVLALTLAASGLWQGRGAFLMKASEARYEAAARFAAALPETSVFLSNHHSGSLRYYANRLTVRLDWLPPDVYGEALEQLWQSGRQVFVVLDEVEREPFRARYGTVSALAWLDEPPAVTTAGQVHFYRLRPPGG
jgi:hypothetical protein